MGFFEDCREEMMNEINNKIDAIIALATREKWTKEKLVKELEEQGFELAVMNQKEEEEEEWIIV